MILFILFIILILIICFIIFQCVKQNKYYGGNKKGDNLYPGGSTSDDTSPTSTSDTLRASELVMTYTISGEKNGLDFSQLRLLFKEAKQYGAHFVERPVTENVHISFGTFGDFMIKGKLQIGWHYDPLFYKQKTAIKNTLGEHQQIINKSELYDTIKKLIPNGIKYLPKSYTPNQFEKTYFSNNLNLLDIKYPIIVKKDNVTVQKGIRIALSKEEYFNAKKELNIKNDAMISEYITNPLLIDGKKFHLRVYFLLSVISGITRCSFYNEYRIRTSKKQYINGDWYNREIHLSGGHHTEKLYYYSDDLKKEYSDNFHIIEQNLNACNKTICMAMTMANVKNYPESYAGFHLYGVDIMLTDDYHPYLLEVNSKPGFDEYATNVNEKTYIALFSHQFFSFMLNSTIFPFFGIVRPIIYPAEFIGNGALSQFGDILTGYNKCYFIPYLNANNNEITAAKNIDFNNKKITLEYFIENCYHYNIFLIAKGAHSEKLHNNDIIGFLSLDKQNFLYIVITEEYQNRGIATAMIAQFLEILRARHYTDSTKEKIYINGNNLFINKIANKLEFKQIKNDYEINYKLLTIKYNKKHKVNSLTYKIIYGIPNVDINFDINKYMTISYSQFVSFIYNLIPATVNKKHSTGYKYDKNFMYQGAELKSSLNVPALFNITTIILWAEKNNITNSKDLQIFDKIIRNKSDLTPDHKYVVLNINNNNYKELVKCSDLKDEYYNIDNYLISEYNPPYLLNNKLIIIRYYLLIYHSGNGVLKFFVFPKYIILTAEKDYLEGNLNSIKSNLAYSISTKKKYTLSDLPTDINTSIIDNMFDTILINLFKLISQYDIKPYPESNAGFNEFTVDIKFIKNSNSKYIPLIHKIFNWNGIIQDNIIDNAFVQEYYLWIKNCIILPHFGLQLHNKIILPNYGTILKYILISKKIQYDILNKIHLEFNEERTGVKIYYDLQLIGHIKLHIKNELIELSHIEIESSYRKQNIALNVVFILMNILRAYYAPILITLRFKYTKQMHDIAFELEFAKSGLFQKNKTEEEYYIKKC